MLIVEGRIKSRIAIIYGRFQPLSRAHYDMIKKVLSMYQTVFIFPVQGSLAYKSNAKTEKGKESDLSKKLSKSPFPAGIRAELISQAFPKLDNKYIIKASAGSIEVVYKSIERLHPSIDTSKIDVYAGPDEYDAYVEQVGYMKKKEEYKDVDIKIIKHDVGTRDLISATKLRASLINPDKDAGFKDYQKLSAPPLATIDYYNKLRKIIKKIQKLNIDESIKCFMLAAKGEIND